MDNSDFTSRRKYQRHTLKEVVKVIDSHTGESVGTVANLSLEGLMLVNSKPLSTDAIYQLCLTVEDDAGAPGAGREIRMGVDCLWTSPAQSETASTYWSGCQIIDISEDDFEWVQEMISSLAEQA